MNTGGHQTSAGVGFQVYSGHQGGHNSHNGQGGHHMGAQRILASSPALLYPPSPLPSPPVKMVSDPLELPAPLVNHPSFFSRQFSLPEQVHTID